MNNILQLFDLLKNKTLLSDFIPKVGVVKRKVGNRYFITPQDIDFEAVSIMSNNESVDWVGIILKKPISFGEIIKNYGSSFQKHYNHYDEETTLTFRGEKNICLSCFLDGYISSNEVVDTKLRRLRISTR